MASEIAARKFFKFYSNRLERMRMVTTKHLALRRPTLSPRPNIPFLSVNR